MINSGLTEESKRFILYNVYRGNLGNFFDPLSCHNSTVYNEQIFKRLVKVIRDKIENTSTVLPIATNYVQSIATLMSGSVLDTGMKVAWSDDNDVTGAFDEWWSDGDYNEKMIGLLEEVLSVGVAGFRVVWSNDMLEMMAFDYDQYYVEDGEVFFRTTHVIGEGLMQKKYIYEVSIEPFGDIWRQRHRVFEYDQTKDDNKGREKPEMIETFFGIVSLSRDGYEPKDYKVKPYVALETHLKGDDGKGRSLFLTVIDKIQALWFYDILKVLDIKGHFLSKVMADPAMFAVHPETGAQVDLSDLSFIPVSSDMTKPEYIQKSIKEAHEAMSAHKQELKEDIAFSLSIPPNFLGRRKNAGATLAEEIKENRAPFQRMVERYRNRVSDAFNHILSLYFDILGIEVPQHSIVWKPFENPEKFNDLVLRMGQAGFASKDLVLARIFPEMSSAEREAELEKIQTESVASVPQGTSVDDLINSL